MENYCYANTLLAMFPCNRNSEHGRARGGVQALVFINKNAHATETV